MVSGTNSVSVIEAYASGNDVHKITKMKINQTWLASQTGPMECSIMSRGCSPSLGPARSQVPEARPKVGAPEDRVRDHGQQQHHATAVLTRPPLLLPRPTTSVSALGPYGVS